MQTQVGDLDDYGQEHDPGYLIGRFFGRDVSRQTSVWLCQRYGERTGRTPTNGYPDVCTWRDLLFYIEAQ